MASPKGVANDGNHHNHGSTVVRQKLIICYRSFETLSRMLLSRHWSTQFFKIHLVILSCISKRFNGIP